MILLRNFIHGTYSNYDPFGEVLISRRFNGGIEVGYSYQKDGKLIEMIPIKGSNEVKAYFNNGKPSFSYIYEDGLYMGEYKCFYSNGNKWIEANYEKDDNQGERKSYYTNGNLRRVAKYKDGRLLIDVLDDEKICEEFEYEHWTYRMAKQTALDWIAYGRPGIGNMDAVFQLEIKGKCVRSRLSRGI